MYYCKECKKVHNTFIDHVKNLIEKYLENMTIKKFKKEFTKGEIKESKFLIAQRF